MPRASRRVPDGQRLLLSDITSQEREIFLHILMPRWDRRMLLRFLLIQLFRARRSEPTGSSAGLHRASGGAALRALVWSKLSKPRILLFTEDSSFPSHPEL